MTWVLRKQERPCGPMVPAIKEWAAHLTEKYQAMGLLNLDEAHDIKVAMGEKDKRLRGLQMAAGPPDPPPSDRR